ncbi:nucleotidyl transferase AbiEii/AbiGii toxin family protein [Candidatus Peregrinibacteria bacterium]|nr:nucleotidyl transferase AbiEii/AbiGii toxin family protein [Candidatus Peregrinibacteria bacterium]
MNLYKKVFQNLQKNKIQYLVVGGVAVNLYGFSRFTGDIDILLALDKKNLDKVAVLMKRMGYVERLPVDVKELGDKKKVENWVKKKGMTAYTFISDKRPQLDIDILVAHSFDFKKFHERHAIIGIWGLKIPVISINDLLKMKKEAGRPKDLIDITELLKLKQQ